MKNIQHQSDINSSTPYPSQPITWQPQPYDTSVGPHKPHKQPRKFKSVGFGLLVFTLLAVALSAVLYVQFFKKPTAHYSKAISMVAESLKTNGVLTNHDLQAINKTDLFLAGMYTTAHQSVQHLISEDYSLEASPRGRAVDPKQLFDATYDYNSHTLNLTHQIASANNHSLSSDRCVDGHPYSYYDTSLRANIGWKDMGKADDYCNLDKLARYSINDGLNAGGMTNAQANTFVQSIFAQTGLLRVGNVDLTTHNGKQYIKITAKITPVKKVIDGKPSWYGAQALMWAFNDTGLDVAKHPYLTLGSKSAGLGITQYIDPVTMLPVYAEYLKDTGLDSHGRPVSPTLENSYDIYRIQYEFGGTVPRGSVDSAPDPITISWPAEKR